VFGQGATDRDARSSTIRLVGAAHEGSSMMKVRVAISTLMIAVSALMSACSVTVSSENDSTARAALSRVLPEPNKHGLSVFQMRVMTNPKGDGVFIYCPKVRENCQLRPYLWLVLGTEVFAINGASKGVTPDARWPREVDPAVWARTGLDPLGASAAVSLVFGDQFR